MGRKVSRQSCCLKEVAKNEKKQLNHLIKVLRPKVYITDISNFKRLVQQLTGNESLSSSLASQDHQTRPKTVEGTVPEVVLIEDDDQGGDVEEEPQGNSSGEATNNSFDHASFDSSFDQLCSNVNTYSSLEGLLETDNLQVQLNETRSRLDVSSMNQQYWDWLAYQEIEAWLLDHDRNHQAFTNLNESVLNHHQEVSVYDYELSWANCMN